MISRVQFMENIARFLPFHSNGCWFLPMYCDEVLDSFRRGDYDAKEIHFVRSLLKKGDIFWDAGANFGLYSLLGAMAVGKEGHVLAIEPDPRNIKRLRRNIFVNRLFNSIKISQISFALGDCEDRVEFSSCSAGAYSSFKPSEVPGIVKKIRVHQTTLDKLLTLCNNPNIKLMKIDVEGAELLVLYGGTNFFQVYPRPIILIEFSDRRTKPYGYRCSDVFEWLSKRDYKWFNFDSCGKLVEQPPKSYYDYENLVGCPTEKLPLLSSWINLG